VLLRGEVEVGDRARDGILALVLLAQLELAPPVRQPGDRPQAQPAALDVEVLDPAGGRFVQRREAGGVDQEPPLDLQLGVFRDQ
jgi:hypothetical protein